MLLLRAQVTGRDLSKDEVTTLLDLSMAPKP